MRVAVRRKSLSEKGITLLEIMLVLAIASFIIVLGLRQYTAMRTGAEANRILFNVDAIFASMANYYKAECGGIRKNGEFKPGKLHPDNSDYQENISISIQNDLIANGYLSENLVPIPVVSTSGIGTNGYVAQFNMDDSKKRKVCVDGDEATGPDPSQGCDESKNIGTIVTGIIQVSVNMKDAQTAKTYKNYLAADCISDVSGSIVLPCSESAGTGTYLVWERLPSFAAPRSQGSNPGGNVIVNQFRQEYEIYPVTYLINSGGDTPDGEQYFLCGS